MVGVKFSQVVVEWGIELNHCEKKAQKKNRCHPYREPFSVFFFLPFVHHGLRPGSSLSPQIMSATSSACNTSYSSVTYFVSYWPPWGVEEVLRFTPCRAWDLFTGLHLYFYLKSQFLSRGVRGTSQAGKEPQKQYEVHPDCIARVAYCARWFQDAHELVLATTPGVGPTLPKVVLTCSLDNLVAPLKSFCTNYCCRSSVI